MIFMWKIHAYPRLKMFDYGNWDEFDYQGPTKNKTTHFLKYLKTIFWKIYKIK